MDLEQLKEKKQGVDGGIAKLEKGPGGELQCKLAGGHSSLQLPTRGASQRVTSTGATEMWQLRPHRGQA